ncbi:MAG: hypothetical protein WAV22_13005 [Porticoccaceae bacterium]
MGTRVPWHVSFDTLLGIVIPAHAGIQPRRLNNGWISAQKLDARLCGHDVPLFTCRTTGLDWLHVYPLLLLATYPAMYLATVVILLYGDLTLYALYSFHFNACVWNVISTPGGMASHTVLVVTGDHSGCAGAYPPYTRRCPARERREVDF